MVCSYCIFFVVSLNILVGRGNLHCLVMYIYSYLYSVLGEIVSLPFLDLGNSYINVDDISSPDIELPSAILLGNSSENTAFVSKY